METGPVVSQQTEEVIWSMQLFKMYYIHDITFNFFLKISKSTQIHIFIIVGPRASLVAHQWSSKPPFFPTHIYNALTHYLWFSNLILYSEKLRTLAKESEGKILLEFYHLFSVFCSCLLPSSTAISLANTHIKTFQAFNFVLKLSFHWFASYPIK